MPRPIISSYREGLSVAEYFTATHGARKGLADTALRTADSGYLTRRLVDVSQDVIIREDDCGTSKGLEFTIAAPGADGTLVRDANVENSVFARTLAADVVAPSGEVVAAAGEDVGDVLIDKLVAAGVETIKVRSVLTCDSAVGVCAKCYGRSLATGKLVDIGEAVGIIAAQSIGEPGTQLTMRTFHTVVRPRPTTSPRVCRACRSCSRRVPPRVRPRSPRPTVASRSTRPTRPRRSS
jgi:DNA-directed RNA polymerase subunit beta'